MPHMRRYLPVVLIVVVVAIALAGRAARDHLGLELSPASIQRFVLGLGWKGPVLYLVLVTFRQFLLLPSAIILPVGGLCFGALSGTILGATGIIVSALLKFSLARGIRLVWVPRASGSRLHAFAERIKRAGPLVVGLATAHPIGPMAPTHWAAGFSGIPLATFAVAVLIGGPIRAGAYSLVGATLHDTSSPAFYLATALLLVVVLLPFGHPRFRRWMIGLGGPEPFDVSSNAAASVKVADPSE